MKTRLITGATYFAILLPLVIINTALTKVLYVVLTMFVCFYGSFELMRAAINHNRVNNENTNIEKLKFVIPILSMILGALACISTYQFSSLGEKGIIYYLYTFIFFIIAMFSVLCSLVVIPNTTMKDFGSCMLGLAYSGLLMGFAFSIRFFEPSGLNEIVNINGTKSFLFVYTIVVLTDSFAMILGCKYGKHRLAPTISPKKSVEGAISGLVGGMIFGIVGLFVYQIIDFDKSKLAVILMTIIISLVISASGQFGDLIESKIKRSFDIKDMGRILPGHGGILDRFDSLLFAGLMYYVVVMIIELTMIG